MVFCVFINVVPRWSSKYIRHFRESKCLGSHGNWDVLRKYIVDNFVLKLPATCDTYLLLCRVSNNLTAKAKIELTGVQSKAEMGHTGIANASFLCCWKPKMDDRVRNVIIEK